MEEKKVVKEEKKIPVTVYIAGATLIFLLGRKSGYKYAQKVAKKNLAEHWYQFGINGKKLPLYFHESIHDDVDNFFRNVNDDLKELKALKEAAK